MASTETDTSAYLGLQKHDFTVHACIGRGASATVWKATCNKSGANVAVKAISKASAQALGSAAVSRVMAEVSIHSKLRHQYILECLDVFEDAWYVYIVTTLADSDLYKLLSLGTPLTVSQSIRLCGQLLSAVQYMHEHNILHRDLKLSNILLVRDEAAPAGGRPNDVDAFSIRVADFGLAVQLKREEEEHRTICGTPNYIAPEVAKALPHGPSADMFSVGCLLYSMLFAKPPFTQTVQASKHTYDTTTVLAPDFTANLGKLPHDVASVLQCLLSDDPLARPTAQQLLQQPLFAPTAGTRTLHSVKSDSSSRGIIIPPAVSQAASVSTVGFPSTVTLKTDPNASKANPPVISERSVASSVYSRDGSISATPRMLMEAPTLSYLSVRHEQIDKLRAELQNKQPPSPVRQGTGMREAAVLQTSKLTELDSMVIPRIHSPEEFVASTGSPTPIRFSARQTDSPSPDNERASSPEAAPVLRVLATSPIPEETSKTISQPAHEHPPSISNQDIMSRCDTASFSLKPDVPTFSSSMFHAVANAKSIDHVSIGPAGSPPSFIVNSTPKKVQTPLPSQDDHKPDRNNHTGSRSDVVKQLLVWDSEARRQARQMEEQTLTRRKRTQNTLVGIREGTDVGAAAVLQSYGSIKSTPARATARLSPQTPAETTAKPKLERIQCDLTAHARVPPVVTCTKQLPGGKTVHITIEKMGRARLQVVSENKFQSEIAITHDSEDIQFRQHDKAGAQHYTLNSLPVHLHAMYNSLNAAIRAVKARLPRLALLTPDTSITCMMDDGPVATFLFSLTLQEKQTWRCHFSMRQHAVVITEPSGKAFLTYTSPSPHLTASQAALDMSPETGVIMSPNGAYIVPSPSALPTAVFLVYGIAMRQVGRLMSLDRGLRSESNTLPVLIKGSTPLIDAATIPVLRGRIEMPSIRVAEIPHQQKQAPSTRDKYSNSKHQTHEVDHRNTDNHNSQHMPDKGVWENNNGSQTSPVLLDTALLIKESELYAALSGLRIADTFMHALIAEFSDGVVVLVSADANGIVWISPTHAPCPVEGDVAPASIAYEGDVAPATIVYKRKFCRVFELSAGTPLLRDEMVLDRLAAIRANINTSNSAAATE